MIKKTFIFLVLVVFLLAPVFVLNTYAQGGQVNGVGNITQGITKGIQNPLGSENQTLIALIGNLLKLAAQIGAVVCVFFIIYSGFLFIKAQGEPAELTKAKSVFFWSIIGAGILLGASVIADLISGTVNSVLK
ncbi:MAG: hypothetical protein WCJ74_02190 [bacterium]